MAPELLGANHAATGGIVDCLFGDRVVVRAAGAPRRREVEDPRDHVEGQERDADVVEGQRERAPVERPGVRHLLAGHALGGAAARNRAG